ncbi:MAG: YwiC-like family protein [Dehalococcoidia bacterium]|nr:YwiC-like family protein [Dehalococcoidia bacterium]
MPIAQAHREPVPRTGGRPPLPREHGAWAMLLIPLVVGLAVAGSWGLEGPLFLGACLALYAARQPITMLAKGSNDTGASQRGTPLTWLAVYLVLALAFGVPLLYPLGRWLLLPWAAVFAAFTAFHLFLRRRHLDRTPAGEFITTAGLALTAPGAYLVARGFEPTAVYLWALTTLYSGASVFYVRMKMRHRGLRRPAANLGERVAFGKANIVYGSLLVAVVAVLTLLGQAPPLVPLAFLPLLVKVVFGVLAGGPHVDIKKVGWAEVVHSIAFTILLIGAYLIGPRP